MAGTSSNRSWCLSISNCKPKGESTTNIRLAEVGDLSFVKDLSRTFSRFGPYEKIIPKWFRDPLVRTYIFERERDLVGFFMLGPWLPPWLCRGLELMAIAVVPQSRRQGVGLTMVEAAKALAKEIGYCSLQAHVGCDNEAALRLFQKAAFRIKRKIDHYYPSGLAAFELVVQLRK